MSDARKSRLDTIEDLEAWMRTRPPQNAQIIAARAALRAAPAMLPWLASPNSFRAIMKTRTLNLFRGLQLMTLLASVPERTKDWGLEEALASAHWAARDTANKLDETAKLGRSSDDEEVPEVSLLTRATAAADSVMQALAALIETDVSMAAKAVNSASWCLDNADEFRTEIDRDADHLYREGYRPDLTAKRLWLKLPEAFTRQWDLDDLDTLFLGIGDDWHVWSRWYRARMEGRPIDLTVEREIAAIPEEIWKAGPARTNAEIVRILAEHGEQASDPGATPLDSDVVPPKRPSPMHFVVEDGVLALDTHDHAASISDSSGERIGWEMLRDALDQMLGDRSAANNPLLTELLAARHALGDAFERYNSLRLGLIGVTLEQMASRADEILLPEDAARFQSILLQQRMLVAQSPDWQEYRQAIESPMADPAIEQEAAEDGAEIAQELIEDHPEVFDPAAATAIRDAAALVSFEPSPDDPDPVAAPEIRRSWIRIFGDMIRAFAAEVLGEGRKVVTKTLGAGAVGILGAVTAKLTGIADKLPSEYAWLHTLVQHVSNLVGL